MTDIGLLRRQDIEKARGLKPWKIPPQAPFAYTSRSNRAGNFYQLRFSFDRELVKQIEVANGVEQ